MTRGKTERYYNCTLERPGAKSVNVPEVHLRIRGGKGTGTMYFPKPENLSSLHREHKFCTLVVNGRSLTIFISNYDDRLTQYEIVIVPTATAKNGRRVTKEPT